MQPGFQIVEDRPGVVLPEPHPRIWRLAAGLLLLHTGRARRCA